MSNLVFYEGWTDTLQVLSKRLGLQFAKDAAWEIINYGTKGKHCSDDSDIIDFVNGMCRDQIEASQKRYIACKQNGSSGGRPKQYSADEIIKMYKEGISKQIIADTLGCSIRTVDRSIKTIEEEDDEI